MDAVKVLAAGSPQIPRVTIPELPRAIYPDMMHLWMLFTKKGRFKKLSLMFKTKNNSSAWLLKVSVHWHDIGCDTTANLIRGKQMWEAPMISCLLGLDLSCDYESLLPSGDMDAHTTLLKMHLRIIKSWFVRASSLSAAGINLLMR